MSNTTQSVMDAKSLQLNRQFTIITPQQLHEEESRITRLAMASYINPIIEKEPVSEETYEQSQDSIEVIKRSNPKVGRTVKPQR